MSRTPGASCLIDVRTTAILQDYIITTNQCAPGLAQQLARRDRLGGTGLIENCQPPACGYDRPRDLLCILGALTIVATAIGTIHTYVVYLPAAVVEYDAGFIEFNLVATMTYLVALLTACFSYPVIEYAGHKLTALFGMIFMFSGILLDSQVFHISILYVGNIVMVGIGAGLAYAASMTLPADLFRAKLTTTLMMLSIAGSLGTIFYMWFCGYVLYTIGYKWTKLLHAMLVLFFTLSVHVFPKTRLMYASGCNPTKEGGSDSVRDCVYRAAVSDARESKKIASDNCEEDTTTAKNLLCVCVCDLRLYGDKSFLLFVCLVTIATINFYIPYMTINSYAESAGAGLSYFYVTVYCVGSMAGRCAFIGNADFTFAYNRTVFQACVFVSGVMWIVLNYAVTFGWILVVCAILGLIEGVLCVVTSRVALGTIPRRWVSGAWLTCMIGSAIGIFTMTSFTIIIAKRTYHYTLNYITSGIIQIIVSLLATLLPNEEEEAGNISGSTPVSRNIQTKTFQKSSGLPPSYDGPSRMTYDLSRLCRGYGSGYQFTSNRMRSVPFSRNLGPEGTYGASSNSSRGDGLYKCKCAICSKFGCIPGCLPDCTPAGSLDCTGTNTGTQPTQ